MSDRQKKMSLKKSFDSARIKQTYRKKKTKEKSSQEEERDVENRTNNRSVESKKRETASLEQKVTSGMVRKI